MIGNMSSPLDLDAFSITTVGDDDGCVVGADDGCVVGEDVGDMVGCVVGEDVGDRDGLNVGFDIEGEVVGVNVGDTLGV